MLMTAQENKIKQIYIFIDRFGNEEGLLKAINGISGINLNLLKTNEYCQVSFLDNDNGEEFAWASFKNSICTDKRFLYNQFDNPGARITNKLINLPDKYRASCERALKSYFTKAKGKFRTSKYKNHQDFIFDIFQLSDGVKAMRLTTDNQFQMNYCSVNKDLPKWITNRFLTSNELPYHKVIIPFAEIEKALEETEQFYYHILMVWYFPERTPRNQKGFNEAFALKHSKQEANYKIAQRRRDFALTALFNNILHIQKPL